MRAMLFLLFSIAGCGGGTSADAGMDAAVADGGGADAAGLDAGPLCEGHMQGRCEASGVDCLCCPAGGPLENCLCTTACTSDADCTDAARPDCNQPTFGPPGQPGICAPAVFQCNWGAVCASPDTPIATADGDRPIAELREGDLVYSVHDDALVLVPIARVSRTAVVDHVVRRVSLASGAALEISAGHPTADGRTFAHIEAGHELGGVLVTSVEDVAYAHPFTYDILPASSTGTYVAGGALIGSTLSR